MGPASEIRVPYCPFPCVVQKEQCPLARHREFKGVVAHAVTRAVVYDDMR